MASDRAADMGGVQVEALHEERVSRFMTFLDADVFSLLIRVTTDTERRAKVATSPAAECHKLQTKVDATRAIEWSSFDCKYK